MLLPMSNETVVQILWDKWKSGTSVVELDAYLLGCVIANLLTLEDRRYISGRLASLRAGLS